MYEYQLDPNTEITAEVIEDAIKFNEEHRPHYDKLDHYYIGDQAIFKRKKADTQVNNRVMINHAKYIVDTNTGYLLGNPVSYTISDEVDIDPVLNAYKRQTIDNLDVELAKDAGSSAERTNTFILTKISNHAQYYSTRVIPSSHTITLSSTISYLQ